MNKQMAKFLPVSKKGYYKTNNSFFFQIIYRKKVYKVLICVTDVHPLVLYSSSDKTQRMVTKWVIDILMSNRLVAQDRE